MGAIFVTIGRCNEPPESTARVCRCLSDILLCDVEFNDLNVVRFIGFCQHWRI